MATVRSGLVLARSADKDRINAPGEKVDIAKCLLGFPDAEYQRCAPREHIAAGYTTTDDGAPHVDQRGDRERSLLVEHHVGEVTEKLHRRWCRYPTYSLQAVGPKSR